MPSPRLQKRYVKGVLKGKKNGRAYLEKALEMVYDLRFALPDLPANINNLVICEELLKNLLQKFLWRRRKS
ncbi:MAG: hypothetical protein WB014_14145 [Methanosarcina sp.]